MKTPTVVLVRSLLVLVALSSAVCARHATVSEEAEVGEVRWRIDTRRMDPGRFRELLVLSPHRSTLPPQLELCVAGKPPYRECGTRTPEAANFFANADINVSRGQEQLDALTRLEVPSELEPAAVYARRQVSFAGCLNRARLSYFRGDDEALAVACDTIDATAACGQAVEAARSAVTAGDRYQRASFDWHNCMNARFQAEIGSYPAEAWNRFLLAYDIQEQYIGGDE